MLVFGGDIVKKGSLPEGNPGTYGYKTIDRWNGSGVNAKYYFRFATLSGSPYTHTIKDINIRITYSIPPPPPATPSGLNVVYQKDNNQNYITWNPVSGATGYKLYWGTSSGVSISSQVMPQVNTPLYTHSTLSPGYCYYYCVTAVNANGESPLSTEQAACVPYSVSQTERNALIALYNATNGDNWTNKSGWKTPPLHTDGFAMPGTEFNWYGVQYDVVNGKMIILGNNNLSGIIPPAIGNLTSFQLIDLGSNQLSGSIPSTIGNLTALQWLDLCNNQLSGSIPPEIGNLTSLIRLNLFGNQLSGIIPSAIGKLTKLAYLDLSWNQLSGSIPSNIRYLTSLQTLNLNDNQLSGSIPPEIGYLTSLTHIFLGDNQLSGSIPSNIKYLTSLQTLNLGLNPFSGRLVGNQLSGSIPPEIRYLTSLQALVLNGNQLSGNIPPEIGYLTSLQALVLSGNQLSGNIPPEIGYLTSLQSISSVSNQLSGSIPSTIGNLTSLQYLELQFNQLSGSIPSTIGNLTSLMGLDFGNNQISGSIPSTIGNLTALQWLNLYNNQISGSIPSTIGNLTSLMGLDFGNNQISGSIPPEIKYLTALTHLYLGNNQLSGSIPPEIGYLISLISLDLRVNQISGIIPSTIENLTSLQYLGLDSNQLSGIIPSTIENLTSLQYLGLSSNQLSGSIPSTIGNLTSLQSLVFDYNQLSGSIPPEIGNLTSLQHLFLRNNQLLGSIPSTIGNLTSLQTLVLGSNQLSGIIPSTIGNLTSLQHLELGGNQLSGIIPPDILNLSNLVNGESDFSNNHLYTDNQAIRDFLNAKQWGGNWEISQIPLIVASQYNVSNISTKSNEFQVWFNLYKNNSALLALDDSYEFVIKNENGDIVARQIGNRYDPDTGDTHSGILHIGNGRYRVWFEVLSGLSERNRFFENSYIELRNGITTTTTTRLNDFTLSVYGTNFDISENAWSFANGSWINAAWGSDIFNAADVIDDYIDMSKRDNFWNNIGKPAKSSVGMCYGLVNASIANFNHSGQPWGIGGICELENQIDSRWPDSDNQVSAPHKPFINDNIYTQNWDFEAAKKIMYYHVSQPFYQRNSTVENTKIPNCNYTDNGENGSNWVGADIVEIKLNQFNQEIIEILSSGSPMGLSIEFFTEKENKHVGHEVCITQFISWNGHDKYIIWDNSEPYDKNKRVEGYKYGPYYEWYIDDNTRYDYSFVSLGGRNIKNINKSYGNGDEIKYALIRYPYIMDSSDSSDSQDIYSVPISFVQN